MSFEEQFDDLIRQKAEQGEFAFDQSNWEKAAGMLDAERAALAKTGARKTYLYLAGTALFIIGVTGALYVWPESRETKKSVSVAGMAEKTISKNSSTEQIVKPSTNNSDAAYPEQLTDLTNDKKLHRNKTDQSNEKAISPRFRTKTIYRTVNSESAPETDAGKASAESPVNNETGAATAQEDAQFGNSVGNTARDMPENELNTLPESSKNIPESAPEKPEESQLAKQVLNQEEFNATADTKEQEPFAYFTLINPTLQQEELSISGMPFTLLSRYENDYYRHSFRKHVVGLEAGTFYNFGWNTPTQKDGMGFNAYAGIGYEYFLSRKISVASGLQFFNLANTQQAFHSATKTEYGFGSVNSGTVLTSNNLYYLMAPLKLYYAANTANRFGVGISAAYLFDARSTEQTYVILDGAKVFDAPLTKKGVYSGSSVYNYALHGSYQLRFSKKLGVNAEFIYCLTDIFSNSLMVKNQEKPLGVRVGLCYTIFEK